MGGFIQNCLLDNKAFDLVEFDQQVTTVELTGLGLISESWSVQVTRFASAAMTGTTRRAAMTTWRLAQLHGIDKRIKAIFK
jgi:hypothetical protein